MKLSKRFLFVPLVLVTFIYLFYTAYREVKDKTLNEFNSQQFVLAEQSSRGIESFFIYYQRELVFLSKLKYISELNDQGKNLLADFYTNHSDQIEAITVVDANGILKYTFPFNKSVIGQDISNQAHVRAVIETHKPTVSDVFISVQGYRAIAYHIPIISGNEYKGSIAILIPLENLGMRFVENIKTGKTGYGIMISENGIVLFSPLNNQTGKSVKEIYKGSPSVLELIDKSLKGNDGTSVCYITTEPGNTKNSIKTLSAFYRVSLSNTFWTIMIFTPEKEVYQTLASFRNHLFFLFSLITIVMITFFYLSSKASTILKEEKKRIALENILKESEKRFRIMFELSPVGIILIDEKGTVIEVNSSFCEILGYSRQEIISSNIRLFSSPSKEGEIEQNIAQILSGKTLIHELKNIRKDGTSCDIALYETMIVLPDGKPGILSVSNDITERKKIYQELITSKEKAEESDKLKTAFIANVSHELRTPLNAIIGFSGLMTETSKELDTISNSQIIFNSGHHLLSLVEDILDISMIETGQLKLNFENLRISSVLEEVKDIIHGERLKENKTGIDLILRIDPELQYIYILTDRRKLIQVLINLLKNSLKFTDEGYVEFGFTRFEKKDRQYIKFYVRDTGIGIDAKYHEIIFNLFRQVDDTYTRKYGGTGLGLSIAKRIIEKLEGEIWVESEPGKGSVFYFTFPFISETIHNESKTADTIEIIKDNYAGKTILIAEDEVSNFEFLRIFLSRKNANVLWAQNGNEVIDICEKNTTINLILMDIKMPLKNGYEATREIKSKRPELPVVALTAYASAADREEALKYGCDDYLPKPIQTRQLTVILNKYL